MSWYTINYVLGVVSSLFAGVFVLYRGQAGASTRKTWFVLCLSVSVWHAGRFLMEIAESAAAAERAIYLIYVGAFFIPPSYLRFILSLLDEEQRNRRILFVSYAIVVVELVLLFTGALIEGVAYYPRGRFYEVPAPMYGVFFTNWVIVPTFALAQLIQAYFRSEAAVKRNQYKYVIYSSLIGFLLGATSFFPFVTADIPPFAAPIVYFYTLPITYAIARYRLMDIEVVLKKSLVHAFLLLTLLAPCFLIVIWGQALAFGSVNYTFSLTTLLLFIVVGFLFPKLRFKTKDALEEVLFGRRIDYRNTLNRSSRQMVAIVDLQDLSDSLVRTVSGAFGVGKASLYLLDDTKGVFVPISSAGFNTARVPETSLKRNDSLVAGLMASREGVVREELQMAAEESSKQEAAKRMSQLEAEITVPIISKEKLIGILNLGPKEERQIYSSEDIELLSTLANQAAIAIENARLYENLKQSQDTIRRADRLSSLGLLTAGLAHEIRNPLVAIRTFTQLLPERYNDADFREGFQGLALKEVDRICGLITDLLSFARPSRPNIAEENVNEIVDAIARILESEAKEKGVEVKRDFPTNLPRIWIDREQMKQVFMNVILNAIQAMRDGGSLFISTRLYSKAESAENGQFLQIEIRDTGAGIPEENLEHIFDPFFTSKDEGSGLGLSISHQIVQEHGGYIVVESKVGKGTSFFINLPLGKRIRAESNGRAVAVNEANPYHR